MRLARQLSHPFSLGFSLSFAHVLHWLRRESAAVQSLSEEALTLATEYGFPVYMASAMAWHGWTLVELGQLEEGFAELRQGLAKWREIGSEMLVTWCLGILAEACAKTERIKDGLDVVAELWAVIDRTGERLWEAEAHRLQGVFCLQSPVSDLPQAEICYHQALDVARHQHTKSWDLRAAMSLARLWQSQGKRQDARDVLAPVYEWFTEGFDTADLKEVKGLLDELDI